MSRRRLFFRKRGDTDSFIMRVKTDNAGTSSSTQFTIPTTTGTYNYTVKTSDGQTITGQTGNCTITFPSAGTYDVKITGTFPRIFFNNGGDRRKLLEVKQWGTIEWATFDNAFFGCENAIFSNITDVPIFSAGISSRLNGVFRACTSLTTVGRLNDWDISKNNSLAVTFFGCTNFNQSINSWNVTNVTTTSNCFALCTSFNQNIGGWVLSSCNNISAMFTGCSTFNNGGSSDINNWSVGSVTDFSTAFQNCVAFNQPLGNWNMASGTNLTAMFFNCTIFNQNLGTWNVSNVTNFTNTFRSCTSFNNGGSSNINNWTLKTTGTVTLASTFNSATNFNQPLNNWNTVAVNVLTATFSNAINFNQDLSSWNVSNVTAMNETFNGATAYTNLGTSLNAWNVSNVTNFAGLFRSCAYNSSLSSWNVANGTLFNAMFASNAVFNQSINSWNMQKATTVLQMFLSATNFDQPLNDWWLRDCTDLRQFMQNKTNLNYSATNLDGIYNGWTNRSLQPSEEISFSTIKYTSASSEARALLTRAVSTKTITNAVNNGSGLIRISATAHGLSTGNKCFISGVLGTTEANNGWIVTVIDANTIDLDGSTFTNTYTSGGTLRTGYGWTITDGGI